MSNRLLMYISVFYSLFVFYTSYGQEVSPINISVNYAPPLSNNNAGFVSAKVGLSHPIVKTSRVTLLAGIGYKWFRNDMQCDTMYIKDLNYLFVPLAAFFQLNNRFKLFLSFETGASSDVLSFAPVNFRYTSNICLMRNDGDTSRWSIILQLTSQNSGFSISPNIFANIRLYNKLYFNGILPFKPKLTWKANGRNHYGVAAVVDRNSYYLSGKQNNRYIEETQADFDLFYLRRLNKSFKLSASIGYTFLHNIKMYEYGEKGPFKIYIFGGTKKAIPVSPDGLIFKVGVYWSTKD